MASNDFVQHHQELCAALDLLGEVTTDMELHLDPGLEEEDLADENRQVLAMLINVREVNDIAFDDGGTQAT